MEQIPFTPDLQRIQNTFISTHWDWILTEVPTNFTLVEALQAKLPHVDPNSWPSRLAWGGTFVNGRDASDNMILPQPCRIEYYEPRFDYLHADQFFPTFEQERICYEDEYLLIYVKPGRLPCVPAREQRFNNLRTYLDKYIGAPCHMPSRLDMSTYGLVPASKHPLTHHKLQQVYQNRKVEKVYLLQTDAAVTWKKTSVSCGIAKHPAHPVLRCCSDTQGKTSHTDFKVLRQREIAGKQYSLIEARPITGRTHQIRVHSHSLACPIIGDNFYQGTPNQHLHLACWQLCFPHPLTGESLDIRIPEHLEPDWLKA